MKVALALLGLESFLPAGDRRQHDLRPEAADRLELAQRRVLPDDHEAGDPNDLRRVGQRQPVVARRERDDAAPTLLDAELKDGVDGTA